MACALLGLVRPSATDGRETRKLLHYVSFFLDRLFVIERLRFTGVVAVVVAHP